MAAEGTVTVKVLSNGRADMEAELHDVSMRGVFFYLHNRVAVGSMLEVVLPLSQGIMPGQADWIRCRCRVVRVESRGGPDYGVAAEIEEFEAINSADIAEA